MLSSSLTKTILRLVVVFGLLAFGIWSFNNYRQAQNELEVLQPQLQNAVAQQERQALITNVRKLTQLPEGEEPLILDIQNAEAIALTQPFFAGAEDGDKLLMYVKAGRSILYSPKRNIIVNEGALSVQGSNLLPLDEENPLQVEVRGGGASQERVDALTAELEALAGVEIVRVTQSSIQYETPLVVALVGDDENRLRQAQTFAANVGLQLVTELPEREASSTAEVVLLVGS